MKLKKFNVSSLTNYIKLSLESDILLSNINLEGEISNLKYHSNGNLYFSLKDDFSKINCVMFSSYVEQLSFDIKDGENVEIVGKISIYPKEGTYQIVCYMISIQGIGELHKEFEILKNKLKDKGYFDKQHKKQIPKYCFNIGVITSITGAVIQDILNVRNRKNDSVNIKIFNSLVQGKDAHLNIVEGIRYFNIEKNVDVIIIARGGGNIEDLWCFNNEHLCEEIFKSQIPIISGVGHETDFTICDFVSDLRASTPTAAAEICIKDIEGIYMILDDYSNILEKGIQTKFLNYRNKILQYKFKISEFSPAIILKEKKLNIANIKNKLHFKIKDVITNSKEKLNELELILDKHDFKTILGKGFVFIEDEYGKIITSKNEIENDQNLILRFSDGKIKGNFTKRS